VARKIAAPIPRLALTPAEAAAAIGVGPDFFAEHVGTELRIVRRGRKRLVPVDELSRWLDRNAELALDDQRNGSPQ
jgi:hypothetical protein